MAFTIPNRGGSYNDDQVVMMETDIAGLVKGIGGDGVLTGSAVTAQGSPDMTVAVAAGTATIGGVAVTITSGNVTITTADATNPRLDLVVVNSSGTKSVTAGTAAAEPAAPAIPASSIVLAMVYVPAAATTIATARIVDKRVIVPAAAAGGGTSTGAVGAEPGSPTTGSLYLPDNGVSLERYSGSAWAPWGPIFPLTDPNLQSWAWVNQGSSTVSTTNGGIFLEGNLAAGPSLRIRKKATPATPFTITIGFIPRITSASYGSCGICWRNAGNGKIITAGMGGTEVFGLDKWDSATAYNVNYTITGSWRRGTVVWIRVGDDGTNRTMWMSHDGQHFVLMHTIGRTDHITADEVGFYVNDQNASYLQAMTLLSWKEA